MLLLFQIVLLGVVALFSLDAVAEKSTERRVQSISVVIAAIIAELVAFNIK